MKPEENYDTAVMILTITVRYVKASDGAAKAPRL